ncbi:MAG: 3-oxoacyl-[acyl-carrier-protein] reductase [Oscillospiraceae bacterium]|nr:3-oxoacyl-[acyl-carrier-protein] reductase [Oscillospiraceae bacterium]
MAKTALITGSSQGLGAAMAQRLAADGFNIAINCRSDAELADGERVAASCRDSGVQSECFICDVSDFSSCERMVKAVKERFGSVDVLVNNAGITRDGLLARMSEEQFDIVTDVNYKSVFNMTRHVSGIMIKQRSGRIINISSVAGVFGNPGQFNYSASKAGIIGMTLTAAKELGGRGITVNAIAPGFIESAMTDVLPDELKDRMKSAVSLGRFGKPEDVAGAVSFFAGNDSGYITGQVLVIDGGLVM